MRMERNGMERERTVKGKKDNYLGNIKKNHSISNQIINIKGHLPPLRSADDPR